NTKVRYIHEHGDGRLRTLGVDLDCGVENIGTVLGSPRLYFRPDVIEASPEVVARRPPSHCARLNPSVIQMRGLAHIIDRDPDPIWRTISGIQRSVSRHTFAPFRIPSNAISVVRHGSERLILHSRLWKTKLTHYRADRSIDAGHGGFHNEEFACPEFLNRRCRGYQCLQSNLRLRAACHPFGPDRDIPFSGVACIP